MVELGPPVKVPRLNRLDDGTQLEFVGINGEQLVGSITWTDRIQLTPLRVYDTIISPREEGAVNLQLVPVQFAATPLSDQVPPVVVTQSPVALTVKEPLTPTHEGPSRVM
jgi:hypothetical protein